jgi:hypothetical protein
MNISNREQLIQVIQQASQPNPEAQEAAQIAQQVQLQFQQSQTNALNGQAAESTARAEKIAQETKAIPVELENDRIKAIATNLKAGNEDDKEFERRMKVTDKLLEERRLNLETAKTLTQ